MVTYHEQGERSIPRTVALAPRAETDSEPAAKLSTPPPSHFQMMAWSAIALPRSAPRAWLRRGQRLPIGDDPQAASRLGVVCDQRKAAVELGWRSGATPVLSRRGSRL